MSWTPEMVDGHRFEFVSYVDLFRPFTTYPDGNSTDQRPDNRTFRDKPERHIQRTSRTKHSDKHHLRLFASEKHQHEIHPSADNRRTYPPVHRKHKYRVAREDTEHADNRAKGRVPAQDAPAELPPDIRHQGRKNNKAGKANNETDRLADRDTNDDGWSVIIAFSSVIRSLEHASMQSSVL
jgi:hypothetical protein